MTTTKTKTVYVPLDGSERAQTALAPAVALADRTGAALVLVAAPFTDGSAEAPSRYLDAQVACIGRPARTWVIPEREPSEAVLLAASSPGALVCMATHGRGALAGAVLGSVAERVLRRSPTPVMLIGSEIDPAWRLGAEPTVVVGIDGSAPARAAAVAAGDLARSAGACVRLLEVVRPSDVVVTGRALEPDVGRLTSLAAELTAHGVAAGYEIVDGYDAADELVRSADDGGAAIIAVGSHGRSRFARAVLGSVSMRTVRRGRCPVLVVGPHCVVSD